MTGQEADGVYVGQYLKDLSDNRIFKVLCNCGGSGPRRHTQRFVRYNPEMFALAEPHELAAYLGVPYTAE